MENYSQNNLNTSHRKFNTQSQIKKQSQIKQKQNLFDFISKNDQQSYPFYGSLANQQYGSFLNSTDYFNFNTPYPQNFNQQRQPNHRVIQNNHYNNGKGYKTQKALCKSFLQTFKTIMKLNLKVDHSKIYYQQALQPIPLSAQGFTKINQYMQLENKKLNIPQLNNFIQIPEIRVVLSQMFKTKYLQRTFQNRRITQKEKGKFLKKLTYLRKAVIQGKLKRLS